jgi:DNA-binding response OmpR family regulator
MSATAQAHIQGLVGHAAMTIEATPSRLRVLIVDDHGPSAQTLAKLLELWGLEVGVCQDGREAIGCAEAFRPDVLLLDLMIPRIDGFQLAQRFREADHLRHVTLIALTGLGDAAHRAQTRDAGFAHHLLKPLIHTELRAILGALERSKAGE